MKYKIISGDLKAKVKAKNIDEAIVKAILKHQPPALGVLLLIKQKGEEDMYANTQTIIDKYFIQ